MSKVLTRQGSIKQGRETTYGVEASSVDPIRGALEFKITPVIATVDNEAQLGVINKANNSETIQKHADVNITKKLEYEEAGRDLLALCGIISTSADDPEVGVYTHTFTLKQDNNHPSFTFKEKYEYRDQMVLGARMNTFEFSSPIDNYTQYVTNYLGRFFETTTETPSVYTEEFKEVTGLRTKILLADDLAGLGSATGEDDFTSCTITFGKNTIPVWAFGSANHTDPLQPREIVNTAFEKTTCAMERFIDTTQGQDYRQLSELQTTKALRIEIENPNITIGTTTNPKITFTFPKVTVKDYDDSGAGLDDLRTESFSFDAYYSLVEGQQVEIELINTTATY